MNKLTRLRPKLTKEIISMHYTFDKVLSSCTRVILARDDNCVTIAFLGGEPANTRCPNLILHSIPPTTPKAPASTIVIIDIII